MSRIVVVLAVLLAVLVPVPGQAVYHFANIDEIMSGMGGDPTAQYVEIRMLLDVQGSVAHSRLTAFSCNGSTHTILLEVPDNVCPAIRAAAPPRRVRAAAAGGRPRGGSCRGAR